MHSHIHAPTGYTQMHRQAQKQQFQHIRKYLCTFNIHTQSSIQIMVLSIRIFTAYTCTFHMVVRLPTNVAGMHAHDSYMHTPAQRNTYMHSLCSDVRSKVIHQHKLDFLLQETSPWIAFDSSLQHRSQFYLERLGRKKNWKQKADFCSIVYHLSHNISMLKNWLQQAVYLWLSLIFCQLCSVWQIEFWTLLSRGYQVKDCQCNKLVYITAFSKCCNVVNKLRRFYQHLAQEHSVLTFSESIMCKALM